MSGAPRGSLSRWLASQWDVRLAWSEEVLAQIVTGAAEVLPQGGENHLPWGTLVRGAGQLARSQPAPLSWKAGQQEAALPVRRHSPHSLGAHTPSLQEERALSSSAALMSAAEGCLQLSEP